MCRGEREWIRRSLSEYASTPCYGVEAYAGLRMRHVGHHGSSAIAVWKARSEGDDGRSTTRLLAGAHPMRNRLVITTRQLRCTAQRAGQNQKLPRFSITSSELFTAAPSPRVDNETRRCVPADQDTSMGRTDGHRRGDPTTAHGAIRWPYGEIPMATVRERGRESEGGAASCVRSLPHRPTRPAQGCGTTDIARHAARQGAQAVVRNLWRVRRRLRIRRLCWIHASELRSHRGKRSGWSEPLGRLCLRNCAFWSAS